MRFVCLSVGCECDCRTSSLMSLVRWLLVHDIVGVMEMEAHQMQQVVKGGRGVKSSTNKGVSGKGLGT